MVFSSCRALQISCFSWQLVHSSFGFSTVPGPPPAAFGFYSISGVVRSVLSAQPVPDSKVSLVLDGTVVVTVTPDSTG